MAKGGVRKTRNLRSFQYLSTWAAAQRERKGRRAKMRSIISGGSHDDEGGEVGVDMVPACLLDAEGVFL